MADNGKKVVRVNDPATEKQLALIGRLFRSKGSEEQLGKLLGDMGLKRGDASKIITKLGYDSQKEEAAPAASSPSLMGSVWKVAYEGKSDWQKINDACKGTEENDRVVSVFKDGSVVVWVRIQDDNELKCSDCGQLKGDPDNLYCLKCEKLRVDATLEGNEQQFETAEVM